MQATYKHTNSRASGINNVDIARIYNCNKYELVNYLEDILSKELERRDYVNTRDKDLPTDENTDKQKIKEPYELIEFIKQHKHNYKSLINNKSIDFNNIDIYGNNILNVLLIKNDKTILRELLNDCFMCFTENTIYNFFIFMMSSQVDVDILDSLIVNISKNYDKKKFFNKSDKLGNTLLFQPSKNTERSDISDIVFFKLLEHKCIDVEKTNIFNDNLIIQCIKQSNENNVIKLLSFVKSEFSDDKIFKIINHKNLFNESALKCATQKNMIEVIKMLLTFDSLDVNSIDSNGKTILLNAIENDYTEIVDILLESKNVNLMQKDKYGNYPITKSISKKNSNVALTLLNKNIDIDVKDSLGRTPLLCALINKYIEQSCNNTCGIKSCLNIENSTDMSSGGIYASYPACFAPITNKCFGIGKFTTNVFDDKKTNENDENTENLLNDIILLKLLKTSSNVNVCDVQGNVPFCLICDNNDIFMFDNLISNPSFDPNFKNKSGISCIDYIKLKFDNIHNELFSTDETLETIYSIDDKEKETDIDTSTGSDSETDSFLCVEECQTIPFKNLSQVDVINAENKLRSNFNENNNNNIYSKLNTSSYVPVDSFNMKSVNNLSYSDFKSESNLTKSLSMQLSSSPKPKICADSIKTYIKEPHKYKTSIDEKSLEQYNVVKYFYDKTNELVKSLNN